MNETAYARIRERLHAVTRRHLVAGAAEAVVVGFGTASLLWLVTALVETYAYAGPAVRLALLAIDMAIPPVLAAALFITRYLQRPGPDEAARMVERHVVSLKQRLITAVQLGGRDADALGGQSGELVSALVAHSEEQTRGIDFAAAVSLARLWFRARLAAVAGTLLLVMILLFPDGVGQALFRLTDIHHAYTRPDRTTIYTLAVDGSVIRGGTFSTPGYVIGRLDEPLTLFYRWEDATTWSAQPVTVDDATGRFEVLIVKPRISFAYYLESGGTSSMRGHVTVIGRPDIEHFAMTITHPSYTGRGAEERAGGDGSVRALAGTRVAMRITATKPLSAMMLVWSDSTTTPCTVAGYDGAVTFVVDTTRDFHVAARDTLGIANADPIQYRVTALEDAPPSVAVLSPPSGMDLPLSLAVSVLWRAQDDYGIARAELGYSLQAGGDFDLIPLELPAAATVMEDVYRWDLNDLNLMPGNEVRWFVRVYDTDTVHGPKSAVTDTLLLRMPSLAQIMSGAASEQDAALENLRESSERVAQKARALDDVSKSVSTGRPVEWSDKNAVQEAATNLDAMKQDMDALSESLRDTADTLSGEDMATIETIEKFRTIADMVDSLAAGGLKDALTKLLQASSTVDPKMLKKNLDEVTVSMEDIQKRLDRIIALIGKVRAIQRFETAKSLLERTAARQAELAGRFGGDDSDPDAAAKEQALAAEMESLENELAAVADDLAEHFSLDTDAFKKRAGAHAVSEAMRQAAEAMSGGGSDTAGERLDAANDDLAGLLDAMNDLDSAMRDANSEEVRRRLFVAMTDMLAVSSMQESLLDTVGRPIPATRGADTDFLARRQLEIVDALGRAGRSLDALAALMVEASGAIDYFQTSTEMSMRSAVDIFVIGDVAAGAAPAVEAQKTLNYAIYFLGSLLQGGEGSSGASMPGDLMKTLDQIANGELSMNLQMGGASQDMMMQLAAEQQKLAEMLSGLSDRIGGDQRLREMLGGLAGDMDDTAAMMRKNEPRELVERNQLDIYRRLLDARRSRREKDEPDVRTARTAERNESIGAEGLPADLGEKRTVLNARIRRALEDALSPEYRPLIRGYFESMLGEER